MPYGQNATVGINFQNSFGTQIVTSNYFLPIISESVFNAKEPLISGEMKGILDEGAGYEGKNSIEGDIEVEIDSTTLGVMCRMAFGPATLVSSDSLRTHTFKPRTADFDTFIAGDPVSILKDMDDAGSASVLYDCCASTFELNIANGELIKSKISVMGGKFTQIAPVAASYPTDGKWSWDTSSFSIAGAANSDLMDITITVDEALENRHVLDGNKTPSHTKRSGFRTVAVAGTLLFNDQTEYQQFLSQSEQKFDLYLSTGTAVQSGYNESLQIIMPAVRYNAFPLASGGPGQLEVGFEGSAKYHTGSATAVEVILQNSHGVF